MKLDSEEFYKLLVRPTVIISTISSGGASNAARDEAFDDVVAVEKV